jgi:hypothetical protein
MERPFPRTFQPRCRSADREIVSGTGIILIGGALVAAGLIWPGVLLRYARRYHWIAGYNTASAEEKKRYDVEGLSHHLGNGLITLGCCLLGAAIAIALERTGWLIGFFVAFLLVVAIIIAGGQKFMPRARFPLQGESGHTLHRFLRRLLPEGAYRALEAGGCGHAEDFWEAGGIRYKAMGEPRQLYRCKRCGRASMQSVRRKPADRRLA